MTALRVVDAGGAPREVGRAHGEEMRAEIAEGLERWLDVIELQTRTRGDAYLAAFAAATEFQPAIEQWAPALIDEVAGIAEGARQDFGRMLAYQMMDEEWAFRAGVMHGAEACTSFGVARDDGSAVIGQNMDLPSRYDGSQVVLRLRPAGAPWVLLFTPAGMIGTTGLNARGVGVCVNAISRLRHAPSGLPVGCVLRTMLARDTVDDAVRVVTRVPHATAQNYLIGGPGVVFDFEASPNQVREVAPSGEVLMHTNHPLENDDLDPAVSPDVDSTTLTRLGRLAELLSGFGTKLTVEDAERALSDRVAPICVSRGSDWMTLGSVVMELSAEPVLHVAPGPPADTRYVEVRFS